jgi:hypothetical protein
MLVNDYYGFTREPGDKTFKRAIRNFPWLKKNPLDAGFLSFRLAQ